MRKALFTFAAVASLALFSVSIASAQCAFDAPKKAKGFKSDMVRAFAPCPGVTHAAPNTASGTAGTPACAPVTPMSSWSFSDKGKCAVKTKQKLESPCSTNPMEDCANLSIQAKCGGILNAGLAEDNSAGWALRTFARATFDDNSNGDMTVIDFPASFAFPDPAKKGKLKLKSDTNALLGDLFGAGSELPGCTSIELLSVKIADPAGNLFANLGSSTR
jgi:hypothetical protein